MVQIREENGCFMIKNLFVFVVLLTGSISLLAQEASASRKSKYDLGLSTKSDNNYRFYFSPELVTNLDFDFSKIGYDLPKENASSIGLAFNLGRKAATPKSLSFDYGYKYSFWRPYQELFVATHAFFLNTYFPINPKIVPFMGMNLSRSEMKLFNTNFKFDTGLGAQIGIRLWYVDLTYETFNSRSQISESNRGISVSNLTVKTNLYF